MKNMLLMLPMLLPLMAGCGAAGNGPEKAAPRFEVVRTATGGPVTLTVRLSREKIGLSETVVLEEEVDAETGFEAELPEFLPEEFEGLGIVGIEEDPVEVQAAGSVRRRRLKLEPERSGVLTIPPREAWFAQAGSDGENSVTTRAIEVTVAPIEDPDSVRLPDPRAELREEEVGPGSGLSPWWAALALPPIAIGAVLLLRKRRSRAAPPRPAHEIAWESLRRLVALNLVEQGEVERFFVILAAILREYVERRFGVRAPERTTEEFLREASKHPDLAAHRSELGAFLQVADRVKFARMAPEEEDIQQAFGRARSFIEATAEEVDHA